MKGELLGLRREDLDLTDGIAGIRRTNSGGLTPRPTHDPSSEQPIALPTPWLRSLEQHRDQQRQEHEAAGKDWQDSGYVFTRPNGAPIEGVHPHPALHRPTPAARLRRIRFHDLRHSAATLLLEQGVELVVIKGLLGHAHIGVTATVCAHVRLRLRRQAIHTLSYALWGRARESTNPDDPPLRVASIR
ncbi:tyrosine-type recombinase/integrase [Streptomyces violascens]|uniref:tyrosine-type recombinase/integrase n=1 Tax=Streptomyces violascens TaxID=67381 RepID=UPI0037A3502F